MGSVVHSTESILFFYCKGNKFEANLIFFTRFSLYSQKKEPELWKNTT